jgi:hypothetical protein
VTPGWDVIPSHKTVVAAVIVLCALVGVWALGAGHYVLAAVVAGRAAGLGYYLRDLGPAPAPLDALPPLLSIGSSLLTVVLPLAILVALPRLLRNLRRTG